ncbi:HGxxPAAW family protein [uncultured Tessaracoccus sp.]|uniref:HGxxPAAW family protein n=1 Tax=uncultured Tessaracoccus sp. TaxID=905023 RepID=UPI0026213DB2|nr:HGxxPAAW family protein [uncultured Tessaracoccus sp.]
MRMARTARYYHHGQSPAAWTGSILAAIGFIVAFVGIMLGPSWVVVAIGSGVVLLAGLVTMVMKAMGFGQP